MDFPPDFLYKIALKSIILINLLLWLSVFTEKYPFSIDVFLPATLVLLKFLDTEFKHKIMNK